MTQLQMARVRALSAVALQPGFETDFVLSMVRNVEKRPNMDLSEKQVQAIKSLAWRYRSDLPRDLVPAQNPATLGQSPTFTEDDAFGIGKAERADALLQEPRTSRSLTLHTEEDEP